MESAVAAIVGVAVLAPILVSGLRHGTLFVAAVAGYTLIRQGLLRLCEERRQSRYGLPVVATAAATTLAIALALMAWSEASFRQPGRVVLRCSNETANSDSTA